MFEERQGNMTNPYNPAAANLHFEMMQNVGVEEIREAR